MTAVKHHFTLDNEATLTYFSIVCVIILPYINIKSLSVLQMQILSITNFTNRMTSDYSIVRQLSEVGGLEGVGPVWSKSEWYFITVLLCLCVKKLSINWFVTVPCWANGNVGSAIDIVLLCH